MITKPSIQFLNNDSDAQLIVELTAIIMGVSGNPSYPTPSPTMPVFQGALDDFSTALANAANGGITLTAIKNDKRDTLVSLARDLASYVRVACKGDLTVLLTSGFPIQKPQRNPIGVPATPVNVSISLGARSGELDAAMPPVFGAVIYNWQLTAANAPTVVLQTAQTTAAGNGFTGLTPGIIYAVVVNAVGSAGASNWSLPVSQMAL